MDPNTYGAIEAFMLRRMSDSAHDKEHVYRVLYTAMDLARGEDGVDRDVLTAACLLHDVGREAQLRDPTLCHAEAGSVMAHRFLLELGWDERRAAHARDCVLTHRYRTDRKPATLEAKLLFDADKLDVTGAIGVARTLFYGGRIGHPLYVLDQKGGVLTAPHSPPSFFREFNFKLRDIGKSLYTPRARALAARRLAAAAAYYDALLGEITDCYCLGKDALRAWMEETT